MSKSVSAEARSLAAQATEDRRELSLQHDAMIRTQRRLGQSSLERLTRARDEAAAAYDSRRNAEAKAEALSALVAMTSRARIADLELTAAAVTAAATEGRALAEILADARQIIDRANARAVADSAARQEAILEADSLRADLAEAQGRLTEQLAVSIDAEKMRAAAEERAKALADQLTEARGAISDFVGARGPLAYNRLRLVRWVKQHDTDQYPSRAECVDLTRGSSISTSVSTALAWAGLAVSLLGLVLVIAASTVLGVGVALTGIAASTVGAWHRRPRTHVALQGSLLVIDTPSNRHLVDLAEESTRIRISGAPESSEWQVSVLRQNLPPIQLPVRSLRREELRGVLGRYGYLA